MPFTQLDLGIEAKLMLDTIGGQWYVLKVENNVLSYVLSPYIKRYHDFKPPLDTNPKMETLNTLKTLNMVKQLTRTKSGCRLGWEDMELDGNNCELYVLMQ